MGEVAPNDFERSQLLEYAHQAMLQLAPKYLGDEALLLNSAFSQEIVLGDEQAEPVPLTRYDNRTKQLTMHIDPDLVLGYAENLQDEVNNGVEVGDIAKVLIGAGIGRSIVGWKATKSHIDTEQREHVFKELLCKKDYLWSVCGSYDDEHHTTLRTAVERLGDGEIIRVNILRFALGASLAHMCESTDLQSSIVEHMREVLAENEAQRQANLRFNLGWLDPHSAFTIYDDTTPELELAFSFPMTPGEELESFAVA